MCCLLRASRPPIYTGPGASHHSRLLPTLWLPTVCHPHWVWAPDGGTCLPFHAQSPGPGTQQVLWGEWREKIQWERGWKLCCGRGGLGSWGPWEARLCPPTHHPPGVLGRARFFGVASDLRR